LDFSYCRNDVFYAIISIVLIAGRFGNGLYISIKPIQKPIFQSGFFGKAKNTFFIK